MMSEEYLKRKKIEELEKNCRCIRRRIIKNEL